jgi:predicted lipid carrier protein YhbT
VPTAGGVQASDPVGEFFTVLAEAGHLETFEGQSATLRFDVAEGADVERWHLTVSDGNVSVTREDGATDAIMQADRQHFEAIVTGRLNAQAAMLRGLLVCEGSMAACIMFQRCLPGPPGSTGRVAPISGATVMSQRRPE